MSRGLGRVQRAILGALTPSWQDIGDVALAVYGCQTVTRAQIESVRRACKLLAAAGMAEVEVRRLHRGQRVLAVRIRPDQR